MKPENEKPGRHWTERLISFLCLAAILAVVVTDRALELWANPPPNWLYVGLLGVAAGVSTEDAKSFVLAVMKSWAGKNN